jgi:hypothetical protein
MPKVEMDVETPVTPERAMAALLDFSSRRPQIWPGITPSFYEVYAVGDTSADIKEGTKGPGGGFWAKEHYDWSTPGLVTWTVRESNFCAPGSTVSARFTPREDGGTRVHIVWDRTPTTFMGRIAARLIIASKGKPVARSFRMGMERLQREEDAA